MAGSQITQDLIDLFREDNLRYDWNNGFQSLYEDSVFTPYEIAEANERQKVLFDSFLAFSHRVAEELVAQLGKPRAEWKVQPLQEPAGFAGGEKFIVGKMFCKFARDDKGLYGGDDELAIKVAKNEIRNGNAVLRLGIYSLHLSMMACHRIKGHAVITTALLPISAEATLVYGSRDAGHTLCKSNPQMNSLIERVGLQMGLMPHAIKGHPAETTVALAGDCEGHVSTSDGRY